MDVCGGVFAEQRTKNGNACTYVIIRASANVHSAAESRNTENAGTLTTHKELDHRARAVVCEGTGTSARGVPRGIIRVTK